MCYGASQLGAKTLKASFKLCGFLLISWYHNILLSSCLTAPREMADLPRFFLGIDRDLGPEPPKGQSIINAPKTHFRPMRGSKSCQKWELAPKYRLKSTANGTKVPKTTPMKETLLPGTQGLANTGVAFSLELHHGHHKYKKTSKLDTFSLSWFLG